MELWLTEPHTPGYSVNWKIKQTVHTEETPIQHLAIVDTVEFGRALILDGIVQVTQADEFIYHEMIAHVPLFTHPKPQNVLVIGGGDGGTVREILKHPQIQVDLVEIDARVMENCQRFLPELGQSLGDSRVQIIIGDGIKYVQETEKRYDIVIIDSSDPIGPAIGLFDHAFYQGVYRVLKADGLMVAQTESPIFNQELLHGVHVALQDLFPLTYAYLTCVPSYIAGFWTFTLASKKYDPRSVPRKPNLGEKFFRYYSPEVHQAAFVLPPFVQAVLKGNNG